MSIRLAGRVRRLEGTHRRGNAAWLSDGEAFLGPRGQRLSRAQFEARYPSGVGVAVNELIGVDLDLL